MIHRLPIPGGHQATAAVKDHAGLPRIIGAAGWAIVVTTARVTVTKGDHKARRARIAVVGTANHTVATIARLVVVVVVMPTIDTAVMMAVVTMVTGF